MYKDRITNFLAVVHAIAGEEKANDIGTHFGGANIYIGQRDAKIREENCLRDYLTKQEIFRIRNKYLELEGKALLGCIKVPKTYIPGVFKKKTKRELIHDMYTSGLWTNTEIIKEVGCTIQYFQIIVRQINLNKKAGANKKSSYDKLK